jgi:hypothetical protein
MLTMNQNNIPDLLSRLIDHNLPPTQQSKHFVRYCQRLLSSKFVTSLQNNDWQNLTRDLPPNLVDKLDSERHFSILYFIISIAKSKSKEMLIKRPAAVTPAAVESKPDVIKLDTPVVVYSDTELLSSILYSFIGIASKQITFDGAKMFQVLEFSPSLPVRDLIKRLLHLSYLYENVLRFTVENDVDSSGIVIQSFCSEIRVQLNDFYRYLLLLLSFSLVAILETNVKSSSKLSLRRLFLWTREPLQRLTILYNMISHAKSLKGGAMLSTMYKGVLHGGLSHASLILDPVVADFTRHLVGQVTKPFFTLIKRWVLEGVCDDAKGEFFIAVQKTVGKDDIWTHRESLEVDMIPSFISETLARKVCPASCSNSLDPRYWEIAELYSQ